MAPILVYRNPNPNPVKASVWLLYFRLLGLQYSPLIVLMLFFYQVHKRIMYLNGTHMHT